MVLKQGTVLVQTSLLPSKPAKALRSRLFVSIIAVALVSFCAGPSTAQAQQKKKSAIGALADLLGKAVRAAVGEDDPPAEDAAAEAVEMLAPAMPAKPQVADVERRKIRLDAYTDAMQEWIDNVCELTDEQKVKIQEVVNAQIEKSQATFGKRDPRKVQNEALLDTFPVKFTMRYGRAQDVDLVRNSRKLKDILTEEQLSKLKTAAAERTSFHVEATLDRVLNLMDEELYLTKAQREAMREPLKRRLNGMESASFSLSAQTYYIKQTPISFLLQRGDHLKLMNEPQQRRAKDFSTSNSGSSYSTEQYVSFQSRESDQWHDKLDQAGAQQRGRVSRACAVRAAFYQAEMGLDEQGSRRLMIAGKGIADRLIADWKKATRKQLKMYEDQAARFGGNFGFSVNVANIQQIEQDELWLHTVKRLTEEANGSADVYDRKLAIRDGKARFLTALFDKELWLRPEQRNIVYERIHDSLPKGEWQNPYRTYMDEVSLLVIPLFKFSKQDAAVFEGAQKKAWDALRGEFDYNGRYVLVHMKNGGQLHLQIPK